MKRGGVIIKLKCIKELYGFTVGTTYDLLGCAGEYVQLKDDDGKTYVLNEGYFIVDDSLPKLPNPPEPTRIIETNELAAIGLFFGVLVVVVIAAMIISKFFGA